MRRAALIASLALAPLAALSLPACSKSDDQAAARSATAPPKIVRDDVYPGVLGVITGLPDADKPTPELRIHHEHIPTFRTKDGPINITADGVPGMKSMIMPFPVAEGLDTSALKVGDKVRFDFAVHWGGERVWEITAFEIIDPDTEIDFSNKAAPGTEDHEDHTGHDHP